MELPLFHSILVSLCFGALIGLIRQWSDLKNRDLSEPSAGLRTYAIWSVLGFISAYIETEHVNPFFAIAFVLFGGLLGIYLWRESDLEGGLGLTSFSIALITFLIGGLVYWEMIQLAGMITASVVLLIASKTMVHEFARQLNREDITSILQFLTITGLILPLVPDQGFGPFGAFNAFHIWLMVILISGLGFIGYMAMRFLGTRAGILLTGMVGGLASSTATTVALTRSSKDNPDRIENLASGIVLANSIMIFRVAAIVAALNLALFQASIWGLGLMVLPCLALISYRLWAKKGRDPEINVPTIKNPLSLSVSIKFGLLYAIIVFAIEAIHQLGFTEAFYPVTFLSGLTQMDAIALTLANSSRDMTTMAAKGLVLAATGNSIFKLCFVMIFGHRDLRKPILVGLLPMIAVGLFSFIWIV